jgi:hypothetical protein
VSEETKELPMAYAYRIYSEANARLGSLRILFKLHGDALPEDFREKFGEIMNSDTPKALQDQYMSELYQSMGLEW